MHQHYCVCVCVCVCVCESEYVLSLSTSLLSFSHSQMIVSFMREGPTSTLPTNTYQVPIHCRALYTVSAQ